MDDLTRRYMDRIKPNLGNAPPAPVTSRQYNEFKEQYLPKQLTAYERACNLSAKVLKIAPNAKDGQRIEEAIKVCHLETTPEGVMSFAIVAPLLFIIIVAALGYLLPIGYASMTGASDPFAAGSLFIMVFGLIAGMSMIIPLQRLPFYLANSWRMK